MLTPFSLKLLPCMLVLSSLMEHKWFQFIYCLMERALWNIAECLSWAVSVGLVSHWNQRWQGQLSSNSNGMTSSMAGQNQGLYYKEESAVETEWWRKVRKICLKKNYSCILGMEMWVTPVEQLTVPHEPTGSERKSDLSTLIKFIKPLLVDKTSYLYLD